MHDRHEADQRNDAIQTLPGALAEPAACTVAQPRRDDRHRVHAEKNHQTDDEDCHGLLRLIARYALLLVPAAPAGSGFAAGRVRRAGSPSNRMATLSAAFKVAARRNR